MNNPAYAYFGTKGIKSMKHPQETTPSAAPEDLLDAVALMAHDIRSPLFSMAATVKLILRGVYGSTDEPLGSTMDGLYRKITRLIGITEECMGRVSVLNGAVRVEHAELDLRHDVVEPVLEELAPEILESHVEMNRQTCLASFQGVTVLGSRFWLKAVFRNLLLNAIKFGGRGCTIALGCGKHGSYCQCNLYNSGKPIPEELQGHLFTGFCKMHPNGGHASNGVGLGLHLTRRALKQHGGNIWYESEPGGSNFIFTLPVRP